MILPIHIALKLQEMLATGAPVPSSLMKHTLVQRMLDDAVLIKKQNSKTKAVITITDVAALNNYLHNVFGIVSLNDYIEKHSDENLTRHEAVAVSGNSKLKTIRTFKGFLVNSYQPIITQLRGSNFVVQPIDGTYTFITDFETFLPDKSVIIIGVENAENFRYIHQQAYLFKGLTPLFVSRYPHSNDLLTWLKKYPIHISILGILILKAFKFIFINIKNTLTTGPHFIPLIILRKYWKNMETGNYTTGNLPI